MPVLDHEVHPSVKVGPAHRYGCWNRNGHAPGYFAPRRRFFSNGSFEMGCVFVPDRMSQECRYDMSLTDPNCTDCKHRGSGENYDRMIRGGGR